MSCLLQVRGERGGFENNSVSLRIGAEGGTRMIDRFLDSIVALEWLYILHRSSLSSAFDGGLDLRVQSRQPDFYKQELRS